MLLIFCGIRHYCSAAFVVLLSTPYVTFQLSRRDCTTGVEHECGSMQRFLKDDCE